MHLGFIGFGHLGKAIAGRLLDCNHTISAWNRTPERINGLPVETAGSPADVAETAEIIFLCLFDSEAVRSVAAQNQGLLSGNLGGKIIVDLSTNHFDAVAGFHRTFREAGAVYLESPVLGSVIPAASGALTITPDGITLPG